MQTFVDLAFADGMYTFRLNMAGIIAIENKCGPIGEVYARVLSGRYSDGVKGFVVPTEGRYRLDDLIEVIRQGLIGGNRGMVDKREIEVSSLRAKQLIETYVHPDGGNNPLTATWELAAAILFTCVEGFTPPEDGQKKSPPQTIASEN